MKMKTAKNTLNKETAIKNCHERHRKICRYWADKSQGCKRGSGWQDLHRSVKKMVRANVTNYTKVVVEENNDENTYTKYETQHQIEVDVTFKEAIKKAVMEILREMNGESDG